MNIEFLDRLARLLKAGKSAACIRAVNRILAEMKKRCEAGEYSNQTEAESAFWKFVEDEAACENENNLEAHSSLRIDDLVPQGVPNQIGQ